MRLGSAPLASTLLVAMVAASVACQRPGAEPPALPLPALPAVGRPDPEDPLRDPRELRLAHVRQLSSGGRVSGPTFSPDGRSLAALEREAAGDVALVVDVATGKTSRFGLDLRPGERADRLWFGASGLCGLALASERDGGSADSARSLSIGGGGCPSPSWPTGRIVDAVGSPVGRWAIAFEQQGHFGVASAEHGRTTTLVTGRSAIEALAPSPDGAWLAWSEASMDAVQLFVAPGTGLSAGAQPAPISPEGAVAGRPAWLPDDSALLFASTLDDAAGRELDLFEIGRDGEGLTRLTFMPGADLDPAVAPNGKALAWVSERNAAAPGERDLFVSELLAGSP
ncbi:MAG: TolB family protein [Deltaproteobacteria bacterium]